VDKAGEVATLKDERVEKEIDVERLGPKENRQEKPLSETNALWVSWERSQTRFPVSTSAKEKSSLELGLPFVEGP
jgi:hypothetical protein